MTTNEAIYKVLTTSMKKWCEEEYKAVKDAGYEINKEGRSVDGYFVIRNPHTGRYVYYARRLYTNNNKDSWEEISHSFYKDSDSLKHVDFVAMLRTPFNREYSSAKWGQKEHSKAVVNYNRLKQAKRDIKWAKDHVEEHKAELAQVQKRLEWQIAAAVKAEARYKELRKELGLA